MGVGHDTGTADDPTAPFRAAWSWRSGAIAGCLATVVMGASISVMDLATLRRAIAGLYGFEGSLLVGWIAHLAHGTLFGTVFAAVLADPGLYRVSDWLWKSVLAGIVYALVLAIAGAGIIMPIWLGIVGFAAPPSLPYVTAPTLTWHLLYGVVLGAAFAVLDGD